MRIAFAPWALGINLSMLNSVFSTSRLCDEYTPDRSSVGYIIDRGRSDVSLRLKFNQDGIRGRTQCRC